MGYELGADVTIDASADRVWAVLTDVESYGEWNPLVRSLDGELREGERVRAEFEPLPGRRVRSTVTITACERPCRLAWRGVMGLRPLLRGEHVYTIEPTGQGVRLQNRETFEGLLLPLARLMLSRTRDAYVRNSEAIKARAEAPSD